MIRTAIKTLSLTIAVAAGIALAQTGTHTNGTATLTATDVSILEIDTPQNLHCKINLNTHGSQSVDISYDKWARAKSSTQEQRFIDLIEIKFDAKSINEDRMTIKVLSPTRAPWEGTDYGVGVTLNILVPKDFEIESRSTNSELDFTGPLSRAKIENDYGEITIGDVHGMTVIKTSYSTISLSRLSGEVNIDAVNSPITADNIILNEDTGLFETTNAEVKLNNIVGSLEAQTSYNSITAQNVITDDGSVVLRTTYGKIDARGIKAELVCETSYEQIKLSDIDLTHGLSTFETSFSPIDIEFSNIIDSEVSINNSYSGINISLPPKPSAKLILTVDEGGKIHTQGFPIKPLVMQKDRLVGIVGDGLSKVEANIDGIGEINIQGR